MPSCYGTAVYGDGYDLERCTCDRRKKSSRDDLVDDRITLLERKVAILTGEVERLKSEK